MITRTRPFLRPCSLCSAGLTFTGICAECRRSRERERSLRALVVWILHSFGCR